MIEELKNNKRLKIYLSIGLILMLSFSIVLGISSSSFYRSYYEYTSSGESWIYGPAVADKPVIYLYPEEEKEIKVELGVREVDKLIVSYPKYVEGWSVIAKPNGDLVDNKTGRTHEYLFYEAEISAIPGITEGFIVKGVDSLSFLEKTLKEFGLTEKEANDFIVYWLPYLEKNEYNLISFQNKWFDNVVELKVSPKPDSVNRLFMVYKGIEEPFEIEEQKIKPFERKGFTVVEWGGMELKGSDIDE